jgi:hypothetical protein
VAEISPELITRDEKGNPQTVRYEAVNAMLLNEFLKEHKTVQKQEATTTALRTNDAKQEATIARLEYSFISFCHCSVERKRQSTIKGQH